MKAGFITSRFLLLCLIILLLVSPIVEEMQWTGFWLNVLLALVIIAAVMNASPDVLKRSSAIFMTVTWFIITFLPLGIHPAAAPIIATGLFTFTISIILTKIFAARKIDADILCASLSVYLLFGIVWTALYMTIYSFDSEAFLLPHVDPDYASVHLTYYSFVTLTTLGSGDILPISPVARTLAATEAVTGVLYIAVMVARLVSLYERKTS